MGVHGFFSWLLRYKFNVSSSRDNEEEEKISQPFSKSLSYQTIGKIDSTNESIKLRLYYSKFNVVSLSIDMNSIFHSVAQKTFLYAEYEGTDPKKFVLLKRMNENEKNKLLFEEIIKELKSLIKIVNPEKVLILSVDGPAPIAKLNQQKQRRYKSSIDSKEDSLFDSNVITPGTIFMELLSQRIKEWLEEDVDFLPSTVIYSSHLVPGEGEHKITKYLNTLNFHYERPVTKGDEREMIHVINGNDADLIMIGLLTKVNYHILRNTVRKDRETSEINLEHTVINVKKIRSRILNQLKISIEDFVFLTFLMGNDFLPQHPSLSIWEAGLDSLIDLTRIHKLNLTYIFDDNIELNWTDVIKLFKLLSDGEETYLNNRLLTASDTKSARGLSKSNRGKMLKESVFTIKAFRGVKRVNYIGLRNNYYNKIFNTSNESINLEEKKKWDIESMVSSYLSTLIWILNYYKSGVEKINIFWSYKFFYSPLLKDIYNILTKLKELKEVRLLEWEPISVKNIMFTPLEQLVSVLPASNLNLIPKELHKLFTDKFSPIGDLNPSTFTIDIDWNVEDYGSIVIIPMIDPKRVRTHVGKILNKSKDETISLLNSVGKDIIVKDYWREIQWNYA